MTRRDLEKRAAAALMTWRRRWERQSEPPTAGSGWVNEMPLWKLAGKLIEIDRKRKRRETSHPR